MEVFTFCNLLFDMGIPPDTSLHFIPKNYVCRSFVIDTYNINVNCTGFSCNLLDIINDSEFYDVSELILDSLTILGSDLLITYTKG